MNFPKSDQGPSNFEEKIRGEINSESKQFLGSDGSPANTQIRKLNLFLYFPAKFYKNYSYRTETIFKLINLHIGFGWAIKNFADFRRDLFSAKHP